MVEKDEKTEEVKEANEKADPEGGILLTEGLDPNFREEVARQPGGENVKRCFACGTCAASCPVTEIDEEYNCRRIIRQILFGMRKEVLSSPVIWLCLVCYRCYARCPQKVNFTDIMRVLRYLAVKGNHVPANIAQEVDELTRLSQTIRHDLVKHTFDHSQELLDGIRARIDKEIEALSAKSGGEIDKEIEALSAKSGGDKA